MILACGFALLAMLLLVAAGCGGGSKNTSGTTTEATTEAATTEAATTEATTTEAATTEATTTEAATTEQTTTVATSGLASAENCRELAELASKLSTAFTGQGTAADFQKEAAVLNGLADKGPADIRDDFKTMAAFVAKVGAIYGNIKPGQTPDPATLQKLQGLQADAQKVTAASQHIAAWVTANCH
jgi:hypothetical protein